jgi:hypothetical protein
MAANCLYTSTHCTLLTEGVNMTCVMGIGGIGKEAANIAKKSMPTSKTTGIDCILLLPLADLESSPHSI